MKKIIAICFLMVLNSTVFTQTFIPDFGRSLPCNQNVNANILGLIRDIPKKATFKIINAQGGVATGVLINRIETEDNLGFYFVTSAHVFKNELELVPDHVYQFAFNYQSPSAANNDVPASNRSLERVIVQSTSTGDLGFQYLHESKIRLVAFVFGVSQDFALVEILKPIPPYFNIAYVGWNPNNTFTPVPIDPVPLPFYYSTMHHPQGDIKKITTASFAPGGQPINLACRRITKLVDLLFGWIWKRKISIEVVCDFTEFGNLPVYNYSGITEEGSSGAGLIEQNDRLVANLKGGRTNVNCSNFLSGIDWYKKFRTSYYRQTIRNTLNTSNSWAVDQLGLAGRKIDCHTKLENLSGEYFAASGYQTDNKIILRSSSTAKLLPGEKIRIHPGADYTFYANEFSMGFNTQIERVAPRPGEIAGEYKVMTSNIPCVDMRQANNIIPTFGDKANNLTLPLYKPLNLNIYINGKIDMNSLSEQSLDVFPNPSANGNFTIRFITNNEKQINLVVKDVLGRTIYTSKIKCIQGENFHTLNLENNKLNSGMYFIVLDEGQDTRVQKVVISN